jgi:hypothetical protein
MLAAPPKWSMIGPIHAHLPHYGKITPVVYLQHHMIESGNEDKS